MAKIEVGKWYTLQNRFYKVIKRTTKKRFEGSVIYFEMSTIHTTPDLFYPYFSENSQFADELQETELGPLLEALYADV